MSPRLLLSLFAVLVPFGRTVMGVEPRPPMPPKLEVSSTAQGQEPVHIWADKVRYESEKKAGGPSPLSVGDVLDWPGLCARLARKGKGEQPDLARTMGVLLPPPVQAIVRRGAAGEELDAKQKTDVVLALNAILKRPNLYRREDFTALPLPKEATALLKLGAEALVKDKLEKLNTLLFEVAFAREVVIHKGRVRILGNATVIKKSLRIDSDEVLAYLDENSQFKRIIATGNVRIHNVPPVQQRTTERPPLKPTPEPAYRKGICHRADYDPKTNTVILTGNPAEPDVQPIVWINKDEVHADRIVFDQTKNLTTFYGRVKLSALTPKGEGSAPTFELPGPK